MTKQELANMIYEQDKKAERNKLKRGSLSFLVILICNTILFYAIFSTYDGEGFNTLLTALIVAFIYSLISYFFCATMFHQLFEMNQADARVLNGLIKRFNNHEYED